MFYSIASLTSFPTCEVASISKGKATTLGGRDTKDGGGIGNDGSRNAPLGLYVQPLPTR
jgi:hypothetical protein